MLFLILHAPYKAELVMLRMLYIYAVVVKFALHKIKWSSWSTEHLYNASSKVPVKQEVSVAILCMFSLSFNFYIFLR